MQIKGSIRAVNLVIRDFCSNSYNVGTRSRSENLAKARFIEKFEEPDRNTKDQRRQDAWSRWITTDDKLQKGVILGPNWAKARLLVHATLANFKLGDLAFTNGSNFEPVGNRTSIACKLEDVWTITPDCFDIFAQYSYWHRALKFSVKKRFKSYCTKHRYEARNINRILWDRFKNFDKPAFEIYKFKLFCIVTFVNGNRWSTVPKNNLKDRSICLEPMCNMLVQRAVGLGVRKCLKDNLGIDLDSLADVHKNRLRDDSIATIDLSDCSDTISLSLVRYLVPSRVFNRILACRSDMTLGPDDNYYFIKKVSSMGNGFTFDLMTLILTALTRSYDSKSSVFGDDIICQNLFADEIVSDLKIAGFSVNPNKTNIRSAYRELCGAHYIDGYGYATTFSLKWLQNPHDLIVACNKVAILADLYPDTFEPLRSAIWKCVPMTLLGATTQRRVVHTGKPPTYELDVYIRYGPTINVEPTKGTRKLIRAFCRKTCRNGNISIAIGYVSKQKPPRSSLSSRDWSLYFQYIFSGRKGLKIPVSAFKSTLVARVDEEQIGFVNALLPKG